jgi:ankyrin repeat protein
MNLLSTDYALHIAARQGNDTLIKELIDAGHNVNIQQPFFYGTPLHYAIACNHLPCVLLLLIHGADPEALTSDKLNSGDNALRLAVRHGRREIVKLLWDGGVQRNAHEGSHTKSGGRRLPSLLEIAAFQGHVEIVHDLLSWSESWTAEERAGALVEGARRWEPAILSTLQSHSPLSQETMKEAFDAAVQNGPKAFNDFYNVNTWTSEQSKNEARVIEILLDAGLEIDLGKALCQVSFRLCEVEAMKMLLSRGADPATRERNGWTPLHIAATKSLGGLLRVGNMGRCSVNEEGIKLLLKYGADVYAMDEEGNTPLHFLTDYWQSPLLEHCIRNGGKPAGGALPVNKHGESVLHKICATPGQGRSRYAVVEALLDAGFDVNERTRNGWTPLICAAGNGIDGNELSGLLLSRGAAATAATDEGWTALHRVVSGEWQDGVAIALAEELIANGADLSALATVLYTDGMRQERGVHQFSNMLDTFTTNGLGTIVEHTTPLHWAAEAGTHHMVRLLLKQGADPLAKDSTGAIPAVAAVWSELFNSYQRSESEVLKLLLRAAPEGFDMPSKSSPSVREWVNQEGYSENWRLWW